MGYLEKNLAVLKECREVLYKYVYESLQNGVKENVCEDVEAGEAKDGTPILSVSYQGIRQRLNSAYRPVAEAEAWAEQFQYQNMRVVATVFGLGNGILLEQMLSRMQEDAIVDVYEPSVSIFLAAMESRDMTKLLADERVFIFFAEYNAAELAPTLHDNLHWTNISSMIITKHTGYDKLFPNEYLAFVKTVKDKQEMALVNRDTQSYFGKIAVENTIRNIEFIKEGRMISEYISDIPKDIPAIIVSAGPSLDGNIDLLKEAKGHAFIVATDTAVRHMLEHNIRPDAMVTLDPKKPSSYISDERVSDVPLFTMMDANTGIMHFHKGVKIWFRSNLMLIDAYGFIGEEFPPYNAGGSVATGAFCVCFALGFERIVLIGQDLAYKGNITHAGNSEDHILNEDLAQEMLDGVDGKPVRSRYDWKIYRNWFEQAIREMPQLDVIDATEGGALIHGSRLLTLREVIDTYCDKDVDFEAILNAKNPSFDEESYKKVEEYIEDFTNQLEKIQAKASSAVKACNTILHNMEKGALDKKNLSLQQQISESNSWIESQPVYDLLDVYITENVTKDLGKIYHVDGDKATDDTHMYQSARGVYQAVADGAGEMLDLMKGRTHDGDCEA